MSFFKSSVDGRSACIRCRTKLSAEYGDNLEVISKVPNHKVHNTNCMITSKNQL